MFISPSLTSRQEYERFVYELSGRYPSIGFSTLVLAPPGLSVAVLSGLVGFGDDIVLCVHEWLNFARGHIVRYSYEVSRAPSPFSEAGIPQASEYCLFGYPDKRMLYWYDSWPHPNDPSLASTHPHHKHVPPGIKHNRIPAPNMSFTRLNLPALIDEIERDLLISGE